MRVADLVEVVRRAPAIIPRIEGGDCLYRNYLANRFLEEFEIPTELVWGYMKCNEAEYGYLGIPYFTEKGIAGHYWLAAPDGSIYDASSQEHTDPNYKQFGTGVPDFFLPELCEHLYLANRDILFKELKQC